MNNTSLDLTIAIPIKNEAKLLQGCIDAIGKDFAQRIVIIDSGSTDESLAIAKANNIEVIQFNWNGHFPKKRGGINLKKTIFLTTDKDDTVQYETSP